MHHMDLLKDFTYLSLCLVSGIMAILFNGIVMSHYTHFNLSPVTQITMQQTLRTLAFIAESCMFAYLGLAIFSFRHVIKPSLVIWSLIFILLGRAANIFPLSYLVNHFREHKITGKMMFTMWFSGLRGAIAFALALHLELRNEVRHVLMTTTLIIVLFTILVFGGSTMPLLKFLQSRERRMGIDSQNRRQRRSSSKEVTLSKTKEIGQTIDSEHLSELTEDELYQERGTSTQNLKGFLKWDVTFLIPLFRKHFSKQELKECQTQMSMLTDQWYKAVRSSPLGSEVEDEVSLVNNT
ncbi:unnamed protein product [Darwinula stevensoni]|uniref:Cation/H+ exchanger transmembrane domain-containing protein n=1 Tax=Darwinula stevensoni TaxID=69355 RepID=A0A7R9A127_9CRUS|nr:unnamed protein product [Darwinula stevensoni]CAG0882540.1 unnamed protein product [Darwinula stevensoni]